MHMTPPEQLVLSFIFPENVCEWFDIRDVQRDDQTISIPFEEKDIPPLPEDCENRTILAKKFHAITIRDFPIRGRQTFLVFRRRYWKGEGHTEYLKRALPLTFPGTKREQEFANFVKE